LKTIRLTGKPQFDLVFSGRKLVTRELVFYFNKGDSSRGRLGIIAGKKVMTLAVRRNRLRRRIRELYREHEPKLKGNDLVVLARRGKKLEDFGALKASFEKLATAVR